MNGIGRILIGIGLVLIGVGIILINSNVNNIYTKETFSVNKDEIDSIKVNIHDHEIIVEESSNDDITLEYYISDSDNKEYNISNKELSLISNKRSFILNLNFKRYPVVVKIPKDVMLDIDLKTSNGKITMDNLDFNQINVKTSNGKITVNDVGFDEQSAFNTTNGSVTLTNLRSDKGAFVTSSNGKINLEDVNLLSINATTSNGSITLDNLISNSIKLHTTNGKIDGSIKGKKEDYNATLKTSNGSIYIDGKKYKSSLNVSGGERDLNVTTTNGKIDLEFVK